MSRFPSKKRGIRVVINERPVEFSFWATVRSRRGHATLQAQTFANDPWNVIAASINKYCPPHRQSAARSFLDQAKDFFDAARNSQITASKPLLSYYAMLNMAKSYILTFGTHNSLNQMQHGISDANSGIADFTNHELELWPSNGQKLNAFAEFEFALTGNRRPHQKILVSELLPQSILGHRMWNTATEQSERFLHVARIEYMVRPNTHKLWLRLYFYADDIRSQSLSTTLLLRHGRFDRYFHQVTTSETIRRRRLVCLEQKIPIAGTRWPSDSISVLNSVLKNNLWVILLTSPPYRRYYAYVAPPKDVILPQLLSIYALAYYFGSITRYRPHDFQTILESPYGSFVREFVDHQILQFAYILAAEFDKRDVVKPAVI